MCDTRLSEFGGYTLWHGNHSFMPIQVASRSSGVLIRGDCARTREDTRRPVVPRSGECKKLGELS